MFYVDPEQFVVICFELQNEYEMNWFDLDAWHDLYAIL